MKTDELKDIPMFANLPADELETIASNLSRTWMQPGKHVAKAGDFAYNFFAILSGDATVMVEGKEVARLGKGDVFGEMALVEDDVRNADVVAGADLFLATMMSWDFRDSLAACPTFKANIQEIINSRS